MVLAMTLASPVFAADRCPEGVICWPDGELIHPRCIQYEWDSSDNVEEWAEHYGVDQEAISKTPGYLFDGTWIHFVLHGLHRVA